MAEGINKTEVEEFDFLSTVKTLLRIENTDKDTLLNIYINLVSNSILNYCHITEIPSALNYVLCTMVADIYRENNINNNIGNVVGNVSSISEDGRSVSFTNGTELKASVEDKISKTKELNRYRKLYFV